MQLVHLILSVADSGKNYSLNQGDCGAVCTKVGLLLSVMQLQQNIIKAPV
jgi:hypothetical protein